MSKPRILVQAWLPTGLFEQLQVRCSGHDWLDGRTPNQLDARLTEADIIYGLPPANRLTELSRLRWVQLISAGVPWDLCAAARQRADLTVTNLAGLYGPTIAEHAMAILLILARNLHTVLRQQSEHRWDRGVVDRLGDLRGKTLAIVGLGNIGRHIARLARAFGMRVVGCRRTGAATADVDRVYPLAELHAMLAEADHVAVAAPLIPQTEGMLGPAEFAAMKPGVIYVNVSRGPIAQEAALLDALRSGRVAAAGLDVFAVEPLPPNHPFWTMPQVIVSPHYSGETVNLSSQPAERFVRNLAAWQQGRRMEGIVDPQWGY